MDEHDYADEYGLHAAATIELQSMTPTGLAPVIVIVLVVVLVLVCFLSTTIVQTS